MHMYNQYFCHMGGGGGGGGGGGSCPIYPGCEVGDSSALHLLVRERSGSVVECLTRDRRAAGSSLTGVTALWSLSKTHLS